MIALTVGHIHRTLIRPQAFSLPKHPYIRPGPIVNGHSCWSGVSSFGPYRSLLNGGWVVTSLRTPQKHDAVFVAGPYNEDDLSACRGKRTGVKVVTQRWTSDLLPMHGEGLSLTKAKGTSCHCPHRTRLGNQTGGLSFTMQLVF